MKNRNHKWMSTTKQHKFIMLLTKRTTMKQITSSNRFIDNKFTSNFAQTGPNMKQYSYSFPFTYTDECKQNTDQYWYDKSYSDLYVAPKHASLKHELLNNKLCSIRVGLWNNKMKEISIYIQTQNARELCASTKQYYTSGMHMSDHPIHFGYVDGEIIHKKHLL
eukprot:681286_1